MKFNYLINFTKINNFINFFNINNKLNINILDKYIAKQIIGIILLVAVALLSIDLFFNLVNELRVIGRGTYSLERALTYLLLTAPSRFYTSFPWAALIGTLIALGMLANHRELVVMRAASISVYRIAWSVIKGAAILTFFVVLLGEVAAPIAERVAQNTRSLALSGGQSLQTPFGLWIRNDQEFIHIKTVKANGELGGITRYQFDKHRKLKEVSYATSAVKQKEGWRLNQVESTRFNKNQTKTIKAESILLPTLFETEILETATVKHPERLSLRALWLTIHQRAKNELNTQNYELAFWAKIFQPILILIMVFIAVPFVFGPLRSATMGFKILAGILVAYLFHTLNGMFAPLALVYQVPPFFAVLLPLLLFSAVGWGLLKRVK